MTQKRTTKDKGGSPRGNPKQRKQRNVSATSRVKRTPTSTASIAHEATIPSINHMSEVEQEDLSMFTESNLLSLANLIKEPQQLAEALGFSPLDIDNISREFPSGAVETAHKVLSLWKNLHIGRPHQSGSSMDGESNSEQLKGSAVDDLIDVLQSLGYFEAVEMVNGMKKAHTPYK
ncbi:unnamed protein product [Dicrocoelium dendriticum]|nr:unnamed protein product [Dicrocoelium dendriticum]